MSKRTTKRKSITVTVKLEHRKELVHLASMLCFCCEDSRGYVERYPDGDSFAALLARLAVIFRAHESELWHDDKITTLVIRSTVESSSRLYVALRRVYDYNKYNPSDYIKRWDNPASSFMLLVRAVRDILTELGIKREKTKHRRYACAAHCGHLIGIDTEVVCRKCKRKFCITCIIEHRFEEIDAKRMNIYEPNKKLSTEQQRSDASAIRGKRQRSSSKAAVAHVGVR